MLFALYFGGGVILKSQVLPFAIVYNVHIDRV